MNTQIPDNHEEVAELLPAYLNGRLDAVTLSLVDEHLASCLLCQQELAAWEFVRGATRQAFAITPLPSTQVMDAVWARLDAPVAQPQIARRGSPWHALTRLWLVFRAQIPLLHKSIWIASALVCLFGLTLTILMHPHTAGLKHMASSLLVLFIVVVGASGSAFIYGSSIDPGFELTLTTPTSMRFLMLCRMALVLGYNFLLALLASAVFALLYGGSLWGFIQLWLGPLLFFSSLGLAISLFVGSTFALLCTAIIEVFRSFPNNLASRLINLPLPSLDLNSTNPQLLLVAFLLIIFAVLFVPKQPRPNSLT